MTWYETSVIVLLILAVIRSLFNLVIAIANIRWLNGNSIQTGKLEKISAFTYPMSNRQKGIVVTLLSPEDPIMGYIIVAPNTKESRQLQQDMFKVFKH